uniref:Peptidase metallopeptidase domain-containing protein n=1 Tax=Poecilia mexicana TaxID=48701 RepID=A0A3B3YEB3_9TELE
MVPLLLRMRTRNISPEMLIFLPILCFLPLTGAAPSLATEQLDTGVDWLSKFGYLPPPDPVTGQLQTKEALTKAIKAMQKFGGLKETGVLQATLGLMKTPRCSLPDMSQAEMTMRRKRSPTPQNKWNKRHLSWRVRTYPKDSALLGRDTVRALMYYALKVWSDIAPLNFHEVAGSNADIQIDFTKADHNDGYPFDGPGGTVAHAFFPGERFTAGDTHFDDDEPWTFRSPKHLVSLRPAQIHRFWRGLPTNLDSVDAVYERPGDHKIVFFKGLKYWVFKDNIVEEGYPRPISDFGLPMEGVDAAFVWLHNDKTYFFKDKYYWRYDDHLRRMDLGYPKESILWKGLPSQLDDVMRWSDSTYFFKGKEYWRVPGSDMEAEAGYPHLIAKDWLLCTEMQSDSPDTEAKSTETRVNVHRPPDHAENGYEVCSCTSDTASPLGVRPSPSSLWLLPLLWTLFLSFCSELL